MFILTKQFLHETTKYARSVHLWDKKFILQSKMKKCTRYWIQELSGKVLEMPIGRPKEKVVFYSDASGTGGASFRQLTINGADLFQNEEQVPPQKMNLVNWTAEESKLSST